MQRRHITHFIGKGFKAWVSSDEALHRVLQHKVAVPGNNEEAKQSCPWQQLTSVACTCTQVIHKSSHRDKVRLESATKARNTAPKLLIKLRKLVPREGIPQLEQQGPMSRTPSSTMHKIVCRTSLSSPAHSCTYAVHMHACTVGPAAQIPGL